VKCPKLGLHLVFLLQDFIANFYVYMSTNLRHSMFTVYKSVIFKAKRLVFSPISEGDNRVLEAKNTNFLSVWILELYILILN
jgi:hypothetical protein